MLKPECVATSTLFRRRSALLALIVGILFSAGCGSDQQDTIENQTSELILPVNVVAAQLEVSEGERRLFTGFVQPARVTELGFGRGGRIARILVENGEVVEANQVLAELDDPRLLHKRDRLVAAREKAQQDLNLLPVETPPLSPQRLIDGLTSIQGQARELSNKLVQAAAARQPQPAETEQTLQQLEQQISALNTSNLAQTRDELERVIADLSVQIDDVNLELDEGRMVAPYSGTVELQGAGIGSMISAGRPAVRLLDVSALQVTVSVPKDTVQSLAIDTPVQVSIDEEVYTFVIKSISPELDQTTRTRSVTCELNPATNTAVVPGALSEVELVIDDRQSGCWLPRAALTRQIQGLWSVIVAEKKDDHWTASRRYVELIRLETKQVFLRGSLEDGEWVVADGLQRIVPGQKIQPQLTNKQVTTATSTQPQKPSGQGDGAPSG